MDLIQQQKAALRRELAAAERTMMPEEKRLSDSAILHRVLNTQEYRRARTVFAFVGRSDEIDTRPLLEQILADGKRLCVPLCVCPGVMECREVRDLTTLHPGAYGISEPPDNAPTVPPECVDLAIIPCAGAAADGRRLGRGGGYYDRFLAQYTGDALLLCRERLLCPSIPQEPHDIFLPAVITEQGRLK